MWKAFLVAIVAAVLVAPPARAQDWWSSWIGRVTPVTTASLNCPSGTYAIGITVKAGAWLDAMRVECATLGSNGQHVSVQNTAWSPYSNDTSAAVQQLRCASGKVLVGFRGRSGQWIDRIQVACKSWSSSQGAYGSISWTSAAGGTTGNAYGPITCPGDKAATAVKEKTIPPSVLAIRPPVIEAYQFGCRR